MKGQQIDLFLPPRGIRPRSLGDLEPIPPGPYQPTLLWDHTLMRYVPPYAICTADGQVIVGHIDNLAVALALIALANEHGLGSGVPCETEEDAP